MPYITEAYVRIIGDESVGIFSGSVTISDLNVPLDRDEMEVWRSTLKAAFESLYDMTVEVVFDFEMEAL